MIRQQVAALVFILALLIPASAAEWAPVAPLNGNAAIDNGWDTTAHVATDGAGIWVTVWASTNPKGDTGSDSDIFFSRSTDNGANWSPSQVLNSTASFNATNNYPKISYSGGAWVVAWYASAVAGGGTDSENMFSRSIDGGLTWSPAVPLNTDYATDTRYDRNLELANDGNGTWIAVWDNAIFFFGTDDGDSYYSRSADNGLTWSAPLALNANADTDSGYDIYPQVASLGSGSWVAIYGSQSDLGLPNSDYIASDVHVRISSDNGLTWGNPSYMNADAATSSYHESPEQLIRSDNSVVAIIKRPSGNSGDTPIFSSRSIDGGQTWSVAQRLTPPFNFSEANNTQYCRAIADSQGGVFVVGTTDNSLGGTIGNDTDIVITRSFDSGATWTQLAPVNNYAATDVAGEGTAGIASDGTGVLLTVWGTSGGLPALATDGDIVSARSTDGGATWTSPVVVNEFAYDDNGRDDSNPAIAGNGANRMISVWDTNGLPDTDIKTAISDDSGQTWSYPFPLVPDALNDGGIDEFPDITYAGSSHWVTAWRRTANDYSSEGDLVYSRSTDNGTSWSGSAFLNSRAAVDNGNDSRVRLASNRQGTVVAAWQSADQLGGSGYDEDIHFARSTDFGATFSNQAVLNSQASGYQRDLAPAVVHTGGTNWLAAWHADVPQQYPDNDIYFARSTDDAVSWTTAAVLNTKLSPDNIDTAVQLATDGDGTCLATWTASASSTAAAMVSRSADHGVTWSTATTITTGPASFSAHLPPLNPRVTWAGGNHWVAVFTVYTPGPQTLNAPSETDIWYSESLDDGLTWSAPAPLQSDWETDKISENNPVIAVGSTAWTCAWNFECGINDGPYGYDYDIMYTSAPASHTAVHDWSFY